MLDEFWSLNAWSSSNNDISPLDASNCPTGKDVIPISERVLVILKSIALSDISTTSLGDISIRSNVESNLFIVSTTIRIPRTYSNSLYTIPPSISLLNESGDVKSVTKLVLFATSSAPSFHPYSGLNVEYPPFVHI